MNPRERVEAERRRLREHADGMRARYGSEEYPTIEEAHEFADEIRTFVYSTAPELFWPEGVEPPADGSLHAILKLPEEWARARAEELGYGGLTRHLEELGYTIRQFTRGTGLEDEAAAEVIAGATVQVNGSPQKIKLTMTLSPDEWSHFAERDWADDEHIYVHARSKPGGVLHPETMAEEIRRWEQTWTPEMDRAFWEFEERQQFYGELSAERGPGEQSPTAEEVDAAMEAYRRRIAAERAEWEREEGWFDVTPDRVDEVQVYGTVLCAECGNPTSVGTVIPNVTDVKGDTLRQVLRPIHLDCFEELQTNSIGRYLSDEIVVELRDFVVVKLEAEEGDE